MSGEQSTNSLGDPTAQPPTPKQTPSSTTSFFSSPVFRTPKTGTDAHNPPPTATTTPGLDWTPRFAEDFSVFNNTPGNLRASQAPFAEFVPAFSPSIEPSEQQQSQPLVSPFSTGPRHHKRPLSAGSIAAEVATHVNHLPSNPNLPLPPVEPSRRLASSPGALILAATASTAATAPPPSQHTDGKEKDPENKLSKPTLGSPRIPRSAKKPRRDSDIPPSGQTATPPPSVKKKGARMLAPKLMLQADSMQTEQAYGHPPPHSQHDYAAVSHQQQQHMASSFVVTPTDMFGYPLSTPSSATFPDARAYWPHGDAHMGPAMDVDFSAAAAVAAGAQLFPTSTSVQQQLEVLDWSQANQSNQMYMISAGGNGAAGVMGQQTHHQPPHQPQQHQPQTLPLQHHQQQQQHLQQQQQQHQQQHHHQHQQQQSQHPHSQPHPHQQLPQSLDPNSMKQQMLPLGLDGTTSAEQQPALYAASYQTTMDDPFGMVSPGGGVDPGLLFSRPPSADMMDAVATSSAPMNAPAANLPAATALDASAPHLASLAPQPSQQSTRQRSPRRTLSVVASSAGRQDLRRSSSVKELAPRRKATSPLKSSRPNLPRSSSETNRPPRLRGRASLPALAPAVKSTSSLPQSASASSVVAGTPTMGSFGTGLGITRSATVGGGRSFAGGRMSPVKYHRQQLQQQQSQQQLLDLQYQQQQQQKQQQPQQPQQPQQQQQQQHQQPMQRLSSLSSIPEVSTPRSRNAIKFTIDANGRARVEANNDTDFEDRTPRSAASSLRRNRSSRSLNSKSQWDSSSDGDSSSTDDEPIVIPSRPTSFVLPDPVKPTIGYAPLYLQHSSRRSASSAGSIGSLFGALSGHDDDDGLVGEESEVETVMNDVPKGAGDAASELEKLRQQRQKRAAAGTGSNSRIQRSNSTNNIPGSATRGRPRYAPSASAGSFLRNNNSSVAVSPSAMTDMSLPTPSSVNNGVRCICGRPDAPVGDDGFVVQCESCEMWLHGRCINITKRTLPSVYICAYCAQTPTARNIRMPPPGLASSPLAHKSFKKFR